MKIGSRPDPVEQEEQSYLNPSSAELPRLLDINAFDEVGGELLENPRQLL